MRPIIIFLVLAGAGIITWLILARPGKTEKSPKAQAMAVSKHSEAFSSSVSNLLSGYEKLSETFVNWDSANVPVAANVMLANVEAIKMDELEKDSAAIYQTAIGIVENIKGTLQGMTTETNIRPQREAFHNLTDNIQQFLNTVKYDKEKLYLQECTMPYPDGGVGQWISKSGETEDRRNPYLGVKDPKYGSGMLKCGETIKEINHTGKE